MASQEYGCFCPLETEIDFRLVSVLCLTVSVCFLGTWERNARRTEEQRSVVINLDLLLLKMKL